MATAEEILATMSDEDVYENNVLVIDNDLRTINIPADVKVLGVESDDDVHRLHFRMPKMCGEFDLSGFLLRINYMNANNEPDVYIVVDNKVVDDHIEFSWLVGRTAAKYRGDVKFIVCAKLVAVDGVIEKEFNTTTAKLPVLEGLETSEAVVQLHPDIIEAILLRLSKLETSGGVSDEQIANVVNAYLAEHPVQAGATAEQAAQIQKNKEDIETLKQTGTGQPGEDGEDGEDGGFYVPSVDTNGNLTWTASKAGMPSVPGANIKGKDGADGEDGHTPIKGTDYWTAEDKAGIVSDVLAALPNASGVNF